MVAFFSSPDFHNPILTAEPLKASGSGNPPPLVYRLPLALRGRRTNVFIGADKNTCLPEKKGCAIQTVNHLRSTPIYGGNLSPLLNPSATLSLRPGVEIPERIHREDDVAQLDGHDDGTRPASEGQTMGGSRVTMRFHSGHRLQEAKSVNDLLKTVYDALEVHRAHIMCPGGVVAVGRRDTNIPRTLTSRRGLQVHQHSLLTIHDILLGKTAQDVLFGQTQRIKHRFPACFAIDYDNAALLDYKATKPDEFRRHTGTPMYISRSACTGQVLADVDNCVFPLMPELRGKARELYVSAHGQSRYARYNDAKSTHHGASPPASDIFDSPRTFRHRPEHDVESIYWSMVSALLQVRPEGAEEEPDAAHAFAASWHSLLTHMIPDKPSIYTDPRSHILRQSDLAWRAQFLGDMKDMGTLLFQISRQIRPEYAFFGDDLQQDHLHEAVQRLVLQYLADHEDITLDPDSLRAMS